MKTTEILLNYIRDNPGCVSSDIYEALKKVEESKNISSLLSDLTKRKVVYREEFYGDRNRKMFKYWIAGAEIGSDIVRLDPHDFDKAVATLGKTESEPNTFNLDKEVKKIISKKIDEQVAKDINNLSSMKKVSKPTKELYCVDARGGESFLFNSYDVAHSFAMKQCLSYEIVTLAKVVKTFKRVVTIVEE